MKQKGNTFVGVLVGIIAVFATLLVLLQMNLVTMSFQGERLENQDISVEESVEKEVVKEVKDSSKAVEDEYKEFIEKVDEIMEVMDGYYYEEYDKEELLDQALHGLVDGVGDPYTSYFSTKEYKKFIEHMTGSYEGIGVVVTYGEDPNTLIVVAPFKDSPGEKAGLLPGDIIAEVDGIDVYGKKSEETVILIKGPEGTEVVLTIIRDGEKMEVPVTREVIEMTTVSYEILDDNMGYIALYGFEANTHDQFMEAINEIDDKTDGLILDLRNNPGGYLHVAVEIIDEIMGKNQLIVYTEDKYERKTNYYTERKQKVKKPIVVLVNGNSASASEILSGVVKDHERGILIGETTFGKGLVQTSVNLEDGSAVKVTISKYYTPDGHYIHGVGIEPHIIIEDDKETEVDEQLEKAKEELKKAME